MHRTQWHKPRIRLIEYNAKSLRLEVTWKGLCDGCLSVWGPHPLLGFCLGEVKHFYWFWTMRPKAKGLAQHGGPPGRLDESGPGRVWFCPWRTVLVACPDRPRNLTRFGAYLLLNVHKTPSWAKSRNKGMAWCSGRPMPTLLLWIWSRDTECKNLTVYALPHKQTSPVPTPPPHNTV